MLVLNKTDKPFTIMKIRNALVALVGSILTVCNVHAQIPVTVTTDVQGALSYIQDAVDQIQEMEQWASQYTQMAQQIGQYSQQIQQYATMIKRAGDPASILGMTGLDGVVAQTTGLIGQYQDARGQLEGLGYRFQGAASGFKDFGSQIGDPQAWLSASGSFSASYSLTGQPIEVTYRGKINSQNYAAYAGAEKAFDAYVQAAAAARTVTEQGSQAIQSLTNVVETATDQATIMKAQAGLAAQKALNDLTFQGQQQAFNDLAASDIGRRVEEEKRMQAEIEANATEAAVLVGKAVDEDVAAFTASQAKRAATMQVRRPYKAVPLGAQ